MPLTDKDKVRLTGYNAKARTKRTFTNKEMEQALRDASHHDGPLSREKYQTYYERTRNVPHPYTIIRRYGKWNDALKAASLPIRRRATYLTRIDQTDCIRALLKARDILGHLPSVGEYTDLWNNGTTKVAPLSKDHYPAASTIRLKFTKWRTANERASQYIDTGMCSECGEPADPKTSPLLLCSVCDAVAG